MDTKLRAYLAEFLGTFVLVYVGAGVVCAFHLPTNPLRLEVTGIALAEGFALAILLSTTYLVSGGCLNPAIALMLYVYKRYDRGQLILLIAVQLLGAVLAGLALRLTFADGVLIQARFGTPHLRPPLLVDNTVTLSGRFAGLCLEIFFTALLTVSVFVSLVDQRGPRVGGMLVGMAQVVVILFGFYLTGGAANPARWFGPVLWEATLPGRTGNPWDDHMVYWAGPIVGALVGALLYSAVIGPPEQGKERR
jgi:MIP family channel proteins